MQSTIHSTNPVADTLIPKHTFGTNRCPRDKNYYEAFNRNNVELVTRRHQWLGHATSPQRASTVLRRPGRDLTLYFRSRLICALLGLYWSAFTSSEKAGDDCRRL